MQACLLIQHQFCQMRRIKEQLSDKEILLIIDFSENYGTKHHIEIQSMHLVLPMKKWLHPGVLYYRDIDKSETLLLSFVQFLILDAMMLLWQYMKPVIEFIAKITLQRSTHCNFGMTDLQHSIGMKLISTCFQLYCTINIGGLKLELGICMMQAVVKTFCLKSTFSVS